MSNKKKLYLVKREVRARSITEAATARGIIYEIALASEAAQIEDKNLKVGFKK